MYIKQLRNLLALMAAVIAFGGAAVAGQGPYCPTEDSCTVSYQHGSWHVTEVVP
jgi:hypothetical protein